MKEAAGEANLTVITIILIGVIVAIATPLINSAMTNTAKRTCCGNYGGTWENGACKSGTGSAITESTYWDATNKKCK